jgi:hypothetical protein
MNALNRACSKIFDFLLLPLDRLGFPCGLLVTSAVFGVLALIAFKYLSAQKRIKATKNLIKGHLIEIRIYQDDLAIVGRAIGKVVLRNFQYLSLNLAPFALLAFPFALVLAQLVVRYGYEPVRIHDAGETVLPGRGAMIAVELERARADDVRGLRVELPAGIRALSPLLRVPSEGRAYQEVVAVEPVRGEVSVVLADGSRATKAITAGVTGTSLQPERGRGFFSALLWPAEENLPTDSPFEVVKLEYPERAMGWFPDGPAGVLLVFLVVSMLAGLLVLKPLRIQI